MNKCNEIVREIASNCADVTIEYLEMGIDALLNEDVLKEIPVIKTVYAITKIPISITNAYNMEKLISFCYHMKDIPSSKRAKYVNKAVEKDKNFGEKLLLTLEKIDDLEKTDMLKKIFQAYGHRVGIDYDVFRRLCIALEKTYTGDLIYLKECIESEKTCFSGEQMINLSNSGLAVMTIYGGDLLNDNIFEILPLGQKFYDCVFTDKYSLVV